MVLVTVVRAEKGLLLVVVPVAELCVVLPALDVPDDMIGEILEPVALITAEGELVEIMFVVDMLVVMVAITLLEGLVF